MKKTSALETAYKDADASLKENIAAQKKALEQSREELTSEYEKAISDAVEAASTIIWPSPMASDASMGTL